jgi:hypothetical protein
MPPREFFECDCHTEGVILDSDDEIPCDIYLAMWEHGSKGSRLSFLERLRWCWNILTKGLPWADQVVMRPSNAEKLAKAILKRTNNAKRLYKKNKLKTK